MADRRSVRVRSDNLERALNLFPGAEVCAPSTRLDGGCSDPACCPQHSLVDSDGTLMAGLLLPEGVSGRQFHRRMFEE